MYGDLEQLEQRLTAIEEKMIARARAAASEEALFEARRALDQELKPYRGKMSTEQLAMLERQFLDRKVIEAAALRVEPVSYVYDRGEGPLSITGTDSGAAVGESYPIFGVH